MVFWPQTQQEKCPDGTSNIPCFSTVNVPNVSLLSAANDPEILSEVPCLKLQMFPTSPQKIPGFQLQVVLTSPQNDPCLLLQKVQTSQTIILFFLATNGPDVLSRNTRFKAAHGPDILSKKISTSRQTTRSVAANQLEKVPTSR